MTDKEFFEWEQEWLGYGYGSGEKPVFTALKKFMTLVPLEGNYDHQEMEKELGGSITWLIINILCRSDIIEYGTSPRYGWLTEKGQGLKKYLDEHTIEYLYKTYSDLCQEYPNGIFEELELPEQAKPWLS